MNLWSQSDHKNTTWKLWKIKVHKTLGKRNFMTFHQKKLTISCCLAEQTLKSSARINKLHVRAHVRLTSITPNWTQCSKIYNWRWKFRSHSLCHRTDYQPKWNWSLLEEILHRSYKRYSNKKDIMLKWYKASTFANISDCYFEKQLFIITNISLKWPHLCLQKWI